MPNSDVASEKGPGRGRLRHPLFAVTAIALSCALVWVMRGPPDDGPEARAAVRKPKFSVDASPEKQRARAAFIEKLIGSGVFEKVDKPVTRPHVYVADGWRLLSAREKQKALGVVLAYHHVKDTQVDLVVVRDAVTEERVGIFSERGLELD